VDRCGLGVGCPSVGQLVCNNLITIWGLGLFGVVFGLWLCNDCFVIIKGHN